MGRQVSVLLEASHCLGLFPVFSNFSEATDIRITNQSEIPYVHRLASWIATLMCLRVTPSLSISVTEHHLA